MAVGRLDGAASRANEQINMSNLVAFANERFTDTYATDLGHELTSS
jgi:hypothetical protein